MMWTDNPIWYRERQAGKNRAARQKWFWRIPGIALVWVLPVAMVVGVGVISYGFRSSNDLQGAVTAAAFISIYLQVLYLCFKGLVAGAGSIARERELQTLETLVSTPLGLERLVHGKYAVAVVPLIQEACLGLVFSAILLSCGASLREGMDYGWVPLRLFALSIACAMFFSALGMLLSSKAVSSTKASSQAATLGITLFAGTYLGDVVLWAMNGTRDCNLFFMLLNPYAALSSLMYSQFQRHSYYSEVEFMWMWAWLITIVIYLLAAPMIVRWSTRRLEGATASQAS